MYKNYFILTNSNFYKFFTFYIKIRIIFKINNFKIIKNILNNNEIFLFTIILIVTYFIIENEYSYQS